MKAFIKKDNKGFSLIELIIVVAIMAVLTSVLVPQFLKYVDKARRQKDVNLAYEMANAIKILHADYDYELEVLYFNKKQAIESAGTEEAYIEARRALRHNDRKVIDADFFDIMGGIPETSLGEEYTWFIGFKVDNENIVFVSLLHGEPDNFDKGYILYPEHEQFMKGIEYTQAEFIERMNDIVNNG